MTKAVFSAQADHPAVIRGYPSGSGDAGPRFRLVGESMPELEPGHKTPCFGYADALVGCLVGSTFASWFEA